MEIAIKNVLFILGQDGFERDNSWLNCSQQDVLGETLCMLQHTGLEEISLADGVFLRMRAKAYAEVSSAEAKLKESKEIRECTCPWEALAHEFFRDRYGYSGTCRPSTRKTEFELTTTSSGKMITKKYHLSDPLSKDAVNSFYRAVRANDEIL